MIPFTQYVRPDGRKRPVTINRPAEIEAKARALLLMGLRLEAEELTTGQVSFTVYDPVKEEDIVQEIVSNGPGVGAAVDRLVEAAYGMVS
jgi:hypothetical protein